MNVVQQETASAAQREIATRKQCAEALCRLSDEDYERLEKIARLRVIGLHAVEWRELLHDAIERLLDGRRQWPRNVPLVVFLRETMRSIASDHWRRLERPAVVAGVGDGCGRRSGRWTRSRPPWTRRRSRNGALPPRETIRRIEDAFEGDGEALRVLAAMASGQSPRETQEEIGIDETRYASTLRRIRRRLRREFN